MDGWTCYDVAARLPVYEGLRHRERMQRVQEAAQRRGHGEHICRHEVREERHSLGMALGLTALGIAVIGVGGELVAQGAEWRVATPGVPALVMGTVVMAAAIPDERNQVPGHDSMPTAFDQSEEGPHDATQAQGEQHDNDHNDLVHYRRPQRQLGCGR